MVSMLQNKLGYPLPAQERSSDKRLCELYEELPEKNGFWICVGKKLGITGKEALRQYRRLYKKTFFPDPLTETDKQMINQCISGFAEPEKHQKALSDIVNRMLKQNGRRVYPTTVNKYIQQVLLQREQPNQQLQTTNSVSIVNE